VSDTFVLFAFAATMALGVAVVARQRGWGMAMPLIIAGAIIGPLPFGPSAPPEPEIVLVAVLAPLVFGESLGSSYLDLRRVSRPVLALAIGLVVVTTVVVGFVASQFLGISWAMALALGAVLAPTDAVAVSTVARRAGLPRRLVSILEGESLVNDGTGLTALKVALVIAAAGSVELGEGLLIFAIAVVVGVAVGAAGGLLCSWLLRRSRDVVAANALILVIPFLLYIAAEEFEGSGILAVVVAGLVIAHSQNADPGHTGRVQSVIVWRHITFVLQALAFFLVGLELPEVVVRAGAEQAGTLIVTVAVVLVVIIATRLVFVYGMVLAQSARGDVSGRRQLLRSGAILGWAGARGPVSGLGAFSIPVAFASGEAVPYRDVILATTFCIIVITLLLSMTLAPLARALGVRSDDDAETMRRVDAQLARAALDRLGDIETEAVAAGAPLPAEVGERLREDVERRLESATVPVDTVGTQELRLQQLISTARAMVRAEQEELIRLRDEEGLPDAIARPLLRQLDMRDQALRTEQR
jgi:CPA1 family monovalent cation:H+ antiporter